MKNLLICTVFVLSCSSFAMNTEFLQLLTDFDTSLGAEAKKKVAMKIITLADIGDREAQRFAGDWWKNQNISKHHEEALAYYKRAAEQGDDHSQYQVAIYYSKGITFLPSSRTRYFNYPEALKLFSMAGSQGHSGANYELGYMYEKGVEGIERDYKNAVYYYALAAEAGHKKASSRLMGYYRDGGFYFESALIKHGIADLEKSRYYENKLLETNVTK